LFVWAAEKLDETTDIGCHAEVKCLPEVQRKGDKSHLRRATFSR